MKEIKIVASDVDGTLLHNGKVSKEDLQAIEKLKEQGIHFFISTGRLPASIERLLHDIGISCGLSTMNGSYCFDEKGVIYECAIPSDIAMDIQSYLRKEHIFYQVYDHKRAYLPGIMLEDIAEFRRWHGAGTDPQYLAFHYDTYFTRNPIQKILEFQNQPFKFFILPKEKKEKVMRDLKAISEIIVTSSAENNLEIQSANTDKFRGLIKVCEHYGYTTDQLLCIGDYWNDYEMIKNAGIGVAMGNAVDELKEVADFITDSVTESGFARAMQKYVLR